MPAAGEIAPERSFRENEPKKTSLREQGSRIPLWGLAPLVFSRAGPGAEPPDSGSPDFDRAVYKRDAL
jgi:hypothetical protein